MKKILILVPHYLPGFKAGGPTRSIANIASYIGKESDLLIITSSRDYLEPKSYKEITPNRFYYVGDALVYYSSGPVMTIKTLVSLWRKHSFTSIYINSFFHIWFSLAPVIALKVMSLLMNSKKTRLVLAPRGEFNDGALKIKSFKKIIYIWLWKKFAFGKNYVFHSTSDAETESIKKIMCSVKNLKIQEISNLGTKYKPTEKSCSEQYSKIKVLTVCRISRIKNIDFGVMAVKEAMHSLEWHIYGPNEDKKYWQECKKLIDTLPEHISVTHKGPIEHSKIKEIANDYDLFFLPSKGENFGHSISEALSLGLPALISDKTPWTFINDSEAGWAINLENPRDFTTIFNNYYSYTRKKKVDMSKNAIKAAKTNQAKIINEYKKLLF